MTARNGFTLIELLAAMVAGTLLLASLGAMVGSLAQELRAPERDRSSRDLSAIAPVLTRLIEGAQPRDTTGQGFELSPSRLRARVAPPAVLGAIGLLEIDLEARRSDDGVGLFAAFKGLDPAVRLPPIAIQPILLADGFKEIAFGAVPAPDDDPRRLPELVTIRFVDAKGREDRLSIRPRITSDGSCRFDPISMACRP